MTRVGVCMTYWRVFHWIIGFIDTLYTPLGTTGSYSAIADLHTLQFTVTLTNVLISWQRIHNSLTVTQITREVFFAQPNSFLASIRPTANSGTQFSFYSKSRFCYDRRSVGQSLLVSSIHLGLTTRFLFLSDRCGFVDVGGSLWRERSHSWVRVPRDSRPYFTVSDSRLPQPGGPGPRIYIPQEQGGPVLPPDTGLPLTF
jgi:hypothetical protein